MAINIITNARKKIRVRLQINSFGDPYIFTSDVFKIEACIPRGDGTTIEKLYLKKFGDLTQGSALVQNIDTSDIAEGMPASGFGVLLGSHVIKIPTSTVSPTAPGTVLLDNVALASATGTEVDIGDIDLLDSQGLIRVNLYAADTFTIQPTGDNPLTSWQVDVYKTGSPLDPDAVQFIENLNIIQGLC